jgi:hypothetical protein
MVATPASIAPARRVHAAAGGLVLAASLAAVPASAGPVQPGTELCP